MKTTIFALSLLAMSVSAVAGVGLFYDFNNMHIKIGKRPGDTILNKSGVEFDVSMTKWGVFDSTGVLASAMAGAANQYTARQEALRNAYVPADGQTHTITYTWNQPNLLGVESYFAIYSNGEGTNISWDGPAPANKVKASASGFDVGFGLPTYDGFREDYGVTLGFTWDIYARNFKVLSNGYDDIDESLMSDPFFVHAIYQTPKFPWLASDVRVFYAPIFGLLGGILGANSQMWGYGAGVSVFPVTSVTLEAQYDTFNGSFTASDYRLVSTNTLWYGVRWDIMRFIEVLTD